MEFAAPNFNSLMRKHPGIAVPAVTTAGVLGLAVIVGHMGEKWNAIRAVTAGLIGGLVCLSFKGQIAEILDRVASYLRNSGTAVHSNGSGPLPPLKEAILGPGEWVAKMKSRTFTSGEREHALRIYHPADRHRYGKAEADDFYKDARAMHPEALAAPHGSPTRNALVALAQRTLSPSFGLRAFADAEAADLARIAKFHTQMLDHDRARFVTEVQPDLHPVVLKAVARLEAAAFEEAWKCNNSEEQWRERVPLVNLASVAYDRTLGHTIELSKPGFEAVLDSVAQRLFDEAPVDPGLRKAFIVKVVRAWAKMDLKGDGKRAVTGPFRKAFFHRVALLEARAFDAAHYKVKEQSGVICALGAAELTDEGYRLLIELWVDRTWRLQARQMNDTRDIPGYRASLLPRFVQLAAKPSLDADIVGMLDHAIARSYLRKHYDAVVGNQGKVPDLDRPFLGGAVDEVEKMIREDRTVRTAVGE